MNRFFILAFYLLCALTARAQPAKETLTGTVSLTTGEVFPYKIEFTERDGVIKGYSFTYKEPNDTKTAIKGMLDRQLHTLTFKETEIIYSHGFQTRAFMCLIDASLEPGSGSGTLSGSISSKETDRTLCTDGTILFSNNDEIKNVFSYHDKYDTVIAMGKRPKENHSAPPPVKPSASEAPVVTEQVTAGTEKSYDWHSDTVVIDVWDGGNVDGDRITLLFNGRPLLTNYFIVKEKRQLRLPLSGYGINTISILANNEGSDPPNTANLLLTDGAVKYSVLAYNTRGNQAIIKIKRVR